MQLDCSVFKSDESVHYNIEMLDAASCVVWHDSWLPDDNVVDAYDVDDESDGRMHGASASGL